MQPQAEAPLGPADLDRLLQCLRNAMSADAGIRSSAEAALQSLEGRPGYCSCLAVETQLARGRFHSAACSAQRGDHVLRGALLAGDDIQQASRTQHTLAGHYPAEEHCRAALAAAL